MPTCANCKQFIGSDGAFVKHLDERHNVHVKLDAISCQVAYCTDCHKYIGKKKVGVEARKAMEKHCRNKHEVDIQEN